MRYLTLSVAVLSGALGGCSSLPRLEAPPGFPATASPVGFSSSVRFSAFDAKAWQTHVTVPRANSCVEMLALSGGGAGGAFGAGALVGWTAAGDRPQFDIVTGVSTGALAASFAFAGPEWDPRLKDAFTGGWSHDLLKPLGVASLFGTSVFQGRPLRNLIEKFITPALMSAVAAESHKGRVLLVATTNLDTEETVVWDMGAIAQTGGDKALSLFRDVLAASASASGVFPPVMIRVHEGNSLYEEMHVDGGVTTPFFVAPFVDSTEQTEQSPGACTNIYVVVNGALADRTTTTSRSAMSIAARSLNTLMNQTVRSELLRVDAVAHLRGARLKYTAVPNTYAFGGSTDFDQAEMGQLFSYAEGCAAGGALWVRQDGAAQNSEANERSAACPATSVLLPSGAR